MGFGLRLDDPDGTSPTGESARDPGRIRRRAADGLGIRELRLTRKEIAGEEAHPSTE
jgi:hypothetical protein